MSDMPCLAAQRAHKIEVRILGLNGWSEMNHCNTCTCEKCPELLGPLPCVSRGTHSSHKTSDGGTWNEQGIGQLSPSIVENWKVISC